MAVKINFDFVSPESLIFSGEVDMVILPGKEGDAGILPNHAPFMTSLRVGVVEVTINSNIKKYLVDGGFADVSSEGINLLAERSFNLTESSSDEHRQLLDEVNKDLDKAESVKEKEDLNTKKEILLVNKD